MTTWKIYRIIDHNECPPVTTFFDTSKSHRDCLEGLLDSGKDLSLIDIETVVVQRSKSDVVNFLNCVASSPGARYLYDVEPVEEKRSYSHLRLVK